MSEHTLSGNCRSYRVVDDCAVCGGRCDICHEHNEDRGCCRACDNCGRCESLGLVRPPGGWLDTEDF